MGPKKRKAVTSPVQRNGDNGVDDSIVDRRTQKLRSTRSSRSVHFEDLPIPDVSLPSRPKKPTAKAVANKAAAPTSAKAKAPTSKA